MATATHPYHDRRVVERRRFSQRVTSLLGADGMRVSWGGVFGGVLTAVGLLVLLSALGAAVGISATQPGETSASTLGTGAGIWAAVSMLLALFVGGLVSTRIGAIFDRTTGFFEGALVWVVAILLMGYLAASGIGTVAGGAFKMIGTASQTMGSMLGEDGRAAVGNRAGAGGTDAKQQAGDMLERLKQNMEEAKQSGQLEQKAQEAKPAAVKAAWITFGALVLSLLAAVVGAMAGRRDPQHP